MKNVKKIGLVLLSLIAAFGFIVTGCQGPAVPENSEPASADDTKTVTNGSEITVNSGESIKIKAEGKSDYEATLPEGVTITYADGIFTISATGDAADGTVTVNFFDGTDNDDGINVTLYVYNPYFVLNLKLSAEVAAKAASISVYAEGKEDSESKAALFQTVDAVYTAGATTAIAKLAKDKANSYKWYNNIKITVKDAAGNEIETEVNPVYFCYADDEFTGITISQTVSAKTFIIDFDGFTIPGGSVTGLKYSTKWASSSADWSGDTLFTPEVTVASDGKSASFAIAQTNEFYIDWTSVVVKDSEGTELKISSGNSESNKWYSYSGNDWSNTLVHVNGTYTMLCDAKEFTSNADYYKVLEASAFENLSISTIKIVVKLTSTDEYWVSASAADSWVEETYQSLAWSDEESGYAGVITGEGFINALAVNGLYLQSKNAAGTVTVEYIAR